MSHKVNILSTRVLENDIISSLDKNRVNVIQKDFIKTKSLSFNKQELLTNINWIVTSKTALKIILNTYNIAQLKSINFFSVGRQTTNLIVENQLKVIEWANYSENLAQKIIKNHHTKHFFFIGGEMRRGEINSYLKDHDIQLSEWIVYTTTLSPNEIKEPIDGLMFFSPSAVQSFVKMNSISNQQLFCIGNTTAKEAKKYSQNIHTPKEQTFKSVIELVNTYYK
jgi:uroporphyrinogen-III synthase